MTYNQNQFCTLILSGNIILVANLFTFHMDNKYTIYIFSHSVGNAEQGHFFKVRIN